MLRKVMIPIMFITWLVGLGVGPLVQIYNKNIMIGGVPCFFVGILSIALLLCIEALILYIVETKEEKEKNAKDAETRKGKQS